MPQRTRAERRVRAAPFRAVEHTHGFTLGAAQSFVSALRQSRVRDTNSTALSQTCLRGNRKKNPFSQCVHHCERGMNEHRDLLSAYRGLHVHRNTDGFDRLDLKAVNVGWLNRQDIDRCRGSVASSPNRRGRRHPPTQRSVARIRAPRKAKAAKRQSRSAQTSTINPPMAMHT